MTPAKLLASLRSRRLTIEIDQNSLLVSPAPKLTAADRKAISEHKYALMDLLGDEELTRAGYPLVTWGGGPGDWGQRDQVAVITLDGLKSVCVPVADWDKFVVAYKEHNDRVMKSAPKETVESPPVKKSKATGVKRAR